jgi:hypothetical protein
MSMNLFLQATLDADTKLGKKKIKESCNLLQTPTRVTRAILSLPRKDIFPTYIEYVKSISEKKEVPLYADDDFFREREPIGTEIEDYGAEHIQEVQDWLDDHNGWDIEWSEI